MTHTLHRQGALASLRQEFVVLAVGDTYFLAMFRKLLRRKFPKLYGVFQEILLRLGISKILPAMKRKRSAEIPKAAVVLNSREELLNYIKKVKEANTGKSIVVSGVFDEVNSCLKELGLRPHTVQYSLGYFGKTALLPRPEVLEVTTMCGHHMISPRLVDSLLKSVADGESSPEKAAEVMTRLCSCGIFNKVRAAKLIQNLVA